VGNDAQNVGHVPLLVLVGMLLLMRGSELPALLSRLTDSSLGNLEKCYHAAFKVLSRLRPFDIFRLFHGVIMRSPCYVLLFLLLIFQLASGQDHSQPKNTDSKTPSANANSGADPSPQVQSGTPHGTQETSEEEHDSNRQASHWLTHGEWVISILTFVYVLLTGVYVFISHKTLKAIEDQGKHALLNAQALINSQRPWIAVRRKEPHISGSFVFEAICVSGIPAKIIQSYAGFQAVDSGQSLQPTYKTEMLQYPFMLAPPDGAKKIWDIEDSILKANEPLWKDVCDLKKTLYFLGKVEYIDSVSFDGNGKAVVHETRWCYEYISGALSRSGPSECNDYT
jgi:hypothetical protein